MIPGKVVGISIQGERSFEIVGLRNEHQPMERDTSFDLGSVTKILATTSIIMKMLSAKEIRLDTKVSEILPEWSRSDKRETSIADLLEHQSGLNEWKPLYISHTSRESAFTDIAENPLKYLPRSGRHYSDLGFITLGRVIENVKKSTLDLIFNEEIARPLNLTKTQFASPKNRENVAVTSLGDRIEKEMVETQKPYPVNVLSSDFSRWRTHRLEGEVNDGNAFHLFSGISGHAGLFSTVDDLLTYGEALLGANDFFDTAVVNEFITPQRDAMQGYGFRNWNSGKYVGHTGFPGIALAIDFKASRVVALMANRLVVEGTPTPTDQLLGEYLA